MPDIERGRLCSIRMDGSDSVPYIIKKDCILFGRSDSCDIRIYVDGVAPEHCLIAFDEEGKGSVEPVNKCGLTFLNGEVIEKGMILTHNDVITVVKRSFRFLYSSSSKYFVRTSFKCNSHFEDNMVTDHSDFDPEVALEKSKQEVFEKRVTFGPRLSPEEFDKFLPPASPLRRGSMPCKNLKKTLGINSDVAKVHVMKNVFKNVRSTENSETKAAFKHKLSNSTVVLQKIRSNFECSESGQEFESRPLFSDILKKQITNQNKKMVGHERLQEFSGRRLPKKTLKFQKKSSRSTTPNSASNVVDPGTEKYSENHEHSITVHTPCCCHEEYPDLENSIQMKCSERCTCQMQTASGTLSLNQKQKRLNKEDDDVHARKLDVAEKETASLLTGGINDVPRLDEHSLDKTLNDISNVIRELSSQAGISSCMSNAFSSPDMCMDVIKKLAITISMVNAYHMYNKIISGVSGFPLCFPSASFPATDSMKCIQNSNTHQSEEKVDFQQFSWFQDVMQYFFTNSLNSSTCDESEQCMLRSYKNVINTEASSSSLCHKKMRSRSAAEKSLLATASGYREKTSKNQLVCYETSLMNSNGLETKKVKNADAVHTKECNTFKVKSTHVENFSHPSKAHEENIFLPDTCLNHSTSYEKDCCSCHQHVSCIQNLCSHVLVPEEVSQNTVYSRKENHSNDNCGKLIKNVRRSFRDSRRKHKFMKLKRKSLSLSYLKKGNKLEKFMEKMSDDNSTVKALHMSFNQRSLRSKVNAALKPKEMKASLILQKYGFVSLKKIREKKNKRKSNMLEQGSTPKNARGRKKKTSESWKEASVKNNLIISQKQGENNDDITVKDRISKNLKGKLAVVETGIQSALKRAQDEELPTVNLPRRNKKKRVKSLNVSFVSQRAAEKPIIQTQKEDKMVTVMQRRTRSAYKRIEDEQLPTAKMPRKNKKNPTKSVIVSFVSQKAAKKPNIQTQKEDKMATVIQRRTRSALKRLGDEELPTAKMPRRSTKKTVRSLNVSQKVAKKVTTENQKEDKMATVIQRRTRSALKRLGDEELPTVKMPRRSTKKTVKSLNVSVSQKVAKKVTTENQKEGKEKLRSRKGVSSKQLPTQRLTRSRQSAKRRRT